MGLWAFLTVLMICHYGYKLYKTSSYQRKLGGSGDIERLQREINYLKQQLASRRYDERLQQLEDQVLFGDYELKKQFSKLEEEKTI